MLPKLDPRVVVPTHYDNFFRPLGHDLAFVRNVKLASVPDEVGAVSRSAAVCALPRIDLAHLQSCLTAAERRVEVCEAFRDGG